MFYDGFDECIVGLATQLSRPVVVYDYEKCVTKLYDEFVIECDIEGHEECDHLLEAEDFIGYNVTGAWVGENTPVFLRQPA